MISTSKEYKDTISDGLLYVGADIVLADGTSLKLTGEQIDKHSLSISDSVTEGDFSIGAAVINSCSFLVNNFDDEFSKYDFERAVVRPWVALQLSNSIETIRKGVFHAEGPKSIGDVISIEAMDNMSKFEKDYECKLTFPTTAGAMLRDVCQKCNVTLNTVSFPNNAYVIRSIPDEITCREVVSYVAQIAGCYARCNVDGQLEIKWFNFAPLEGREIDGGDHENYSQQKTADGGNFDSYNQSREISGGNFDDLSSYFTLYPLYSLEVSNDDIVITGIRVAEDGDEAGVHLFGKEGYVLKIEGNPFIPAGRGKEVAEYLGAKMVGTRLRLFNATGPGDPSMEAGDIVKLPDTKGRSYGGVLTHYNYQHEGICNFSCEGESPGANSAARNSQTARTVIELIKHIEKEKTSREQAVDELAGLLKNSSGLHKTIDQQADGSDIFYFHDKNTVAESTIIIMVTNKAVGISFDGGKTYPNGYTFVDSKMIINTLETEGINASWITSGTFESGTINIGKGNFVVDSKGNLISKGDAEFTNAHIKGGSITLESTEKNPQLIVLENNYKGIIAGARIAVEGNTSVSALTPTYITTQGLLYVGGDGAASKLSSIGGTLMVSNLLNLSDEKAKRKISELSLAESEKIIDALISKKYQFKESDTDGFHFGFIEQDLEEFSKKQGYDLCVNREIEQGGEKKQIIGINYTDLFSPMVKVIQSQKKELKKLRKQVEKQAELIDKLMKFVGMEVE